jgi:hypothetical protein
MKNTPAATFAQRPRAEPRGSLTARGHPWETTRSHEEMIAINGLNHADVLAALYNASKPQGLGMLHFDPKPMERAEAAELLDQTRYFDYLKGRVMKVFVDGDELDPRLYDRDNGQGAAAMAIASLRHDGDPAARAAQ